MVLVCRNRCGASIESGAMTEVFMPSTDQVFKYVFGNARDLRPLRGLLSATLEVTEAALGQVTIADPHLMPNRHRGKLGIIDVHAQISGGRSAQVELQLLAQRGFEKRLAFYNSRLLENSADQRDDYEQLRQAITIAITGFNFLPGEDCYHRTFGLREQASGVDLTDVIRIDTLELRKLPSVSDGSLLWGWARFIASKTKEELDMIATISPEIASAVDTVYQFSAEKLAKIQAMREDMARRDLIQYRSDARHQGLEEGREEGREEGQLMAAREIGRRLLDQGLPLDQVAAAVGLPIDELRHIQTVTS
jgi:predicted transposase/invertase (TIGR01784 family)